jgi:hypothetical protein
MPTLSITLHIEADEWADFLDDSVVADAIGDVQHDAAMAVVQLAEDRAGGGSVSGEVWNVSVYNE